jgi:hypothetical protein
MTYNPKTHMNVARKVARDPSIPRWLRALLIFGILPIPGPVDNIALVIGAVILLTCYRDVVAGHYAYEATMTPIVPLDTWGGWS